MEKKEVKKESKAGKTYLKEVPKKLWTEAPRNGVYKLYPKESIEIAGFIVKNETREVVKIVSGEVLPAKLTSKKK